jgi:hypothetical protein
MTRAAADDATLEVEKLLSEGLNLCVRARNLDSMDRRANTLAASSCEDEWLRDGKFDRHVKRNNIVRPHAPIHPTCVSPQSWVLDQYEKDLHDWEQRARKALTDRGWSTP